MKLRSKTSVADHALLDRHIRLVRETEPPLLPDTDARWMLRRAMLAGAARRRTRVQTRRWFMVGAAVGAVLAGVWLVREARPHLRRPVAHEAPGEKPLRMRLPSDDTLVASPGAKFELQVATANGRRIRLNRGDMMFEVRPLRSGQYFEVNTPHARVRVRGTVFTTTVTSSRTAVRVYQGEVQVETPVASRLLRTGESYASDGAPISPTQDAPLHTEALAAMAPQEAAMQDATVGERSQEGEGPAEGAAVMQESATEETALQQSAIDETALEDSSQGPTQQGPSPTVSSQRSPFDIFADSCPNSGQLTLQRARACLHQGYSERALLAARAASPLTARARGAWKMVEGDALRDQGRFEPAVQAYDQASQLLPPEMSAQAGYLAALVYARQLERPHEALHMLDRAGVDDEGSGLRERGLLLRAHVLKSLGRSPEEVACRYLADFPDSAGAPAMSLHCPNASAPK